MAAKSLSERNSLSESVYVQHPFAIAMSILPRHPFLHIVVRSQLLASAQFDYQ